MERAEYPPWQKMSRTALPTELVFGTWKEMPSKTLLEAKDRISALEAMKRWEILKKMVNPYEIVYTHEDRHFHPSIALIKPLSRSYFKMIEMMHVLQFFEMLPKQQPKIRSAHIAEGPGGFIQALIELCERKNKILQKATAMTLKSNDQRVPGWRRASVFLHHHHEIKLHFGADGTGDVYKIENQNSFIEESPSVNIFTADGGFDFSVNYEIQEQRVFHLLVCSALTGLRCLSKEGVFILKIFDMFSEHTKFLVILLGHCFSEWMLYKPSLSRPCNSERYFLGRGFRGASQPVLDLLDKIRVNAANDLYPTDVSACFSPEESQYLNEHISLNTDDQLKAIERAEVYAQQPDLWYSKQLPLDFKRSLAWCEKFRIPTLQKQPSKISPVSFF